jgi:hypothetical protein
VEKEWRENNPNKVIQRAENQGVSELHAREKASVDKWRHKKEDEVKSMEEYKEKVSTTDDPVEWATKKYGKRPCPGKSDADAKKENCDNKAKCEWNYHIPGKCVPKIWCERKYKFGDMTLSQSCRLSSGIIMEEVNRVFKKHHAGATATKKNENGKVIEAGNAANDTNCYWNYNPIKTGCHPKALCSYQYKPGDWHLTQSCRLKDRPPAKEPKSDADCEWDFKVPGSCEPAEYCSRQYRPGDMTLSSSCRVATGASPARPESDRGCKWSYSMSGKFSWSKGFSGGGCVPSDWCSYQYKMWDTTLSQSCRMANPDFPPAGKYPCPPGTTDEGAEQLDCDIVYTKENPFPDSAPEVEVEAKVIDCSQRAMVEGPPDTGKDFGVTRNTHQLCTTGTWYDYKNEAECRKADKNPENCPAAPAKMCIGEQLGWDTTELESVTTAINKKATIKLKNDVVFSIPVAARRAEVEALAAVNKFEYISVSEPSAMIHDVKLSTGESYISPAVGVMAAKCEMCQHVFHPQYIGNALNTRRGGLLGPFGKRGMLKREEVEQDCVKVCQYHAPDHLTKCTKSCQSMFENNELRSRVCAKQGLDADIVQKMNNEVYKGKFLQCVHGGVDINFKVPIVGKSLAISGGATHAKFAKMLQQYREGVDKQADVKKHTKNPCDSLHLNYCPIGARTHMEIWRQKDVPKPADKSLGRKCVFQCRKQDKWILGMEKSSKKCPALDEVSVFGCDECECKECRALAFADCMKRSGNDCNSEAVLLLRESYD